MKNTRQTVRNWLETGIVDIFLGYREVDGHPVPHGFTGEHLEEIDNLVISDNRYSLEKLATHLGTRHPEATIGMLARDCSSRAINVLAVWNQIDGKRVKTIPVNCCPSRLKKHADCSYLEPEENGKFKQLMGLSKSSEIAETETKQQDELLSRWMYELQKMH